MIDDFKRWVFCLLVLTLQFVLSPLAIASAADNLIGTVAVKSPESSHQKSDIHGPSVQTVSSAESKRQPTLTRNKANDGSRQGSGAFVVPEEHDLEGLIGVSEIPVSVDVDGQFIKALAENPILENESVKRVDETDLSNSLNTGREFNRQSRAALARIEQAKAQTAQAMGLLLPTVSIRANRGSEVSKPSVVVDPDTGGLLPRSQHIRTDVSLIATQPLFDLPTFLEWRRRRAVEEVRKKGYRAIDGDAFIATVKTYLSLVSTRLQADVTHDFEVQLEELLRYIEKRADAGAASVSDMSRVRARQQATRSSRLEKESAHLAAGTEFVRLTNLEPRMVRLPKIEDLGASLLPQTFDKAVVEAMQANPEISALKAQLHSEKINQSIAKGRFLPRFNAEYTDTYSDHAGGSSEDQRDRRIMLVLNWSLFDGGRDVNSLSERAARYQELQYRLDDERRHVVQALASDYAALATIRARIASGYQELESITTAANAMSKRMLSGNQSLLDLLDVYDRYFQARSSLISLHVLEMNTVAQLIRLTRGTPWPAS